MTKEERIKLVFEIISKIAGFEIKPNKDFYMIVNGIKGVYQLGESLNLYCKTPNGYYSVCKAPNGYYRVIDYNILLIFNEEYQLEEIKEPLVTEEEKEFLRGFRFESLEAHAYFSDIETIVALRLTSQGGLYYTIPVNMTNHEFKGLEANRKYTEKELGL